MSIGAKNRRIEIWEMSPYRDDANEPISKPWVLLKEKWAEVRGQTGMAAIRNSEGINTPLDRYSFRVNYDTSITIEMQVRERDGTRYNVLSVRHDKADREWTDIIAETGGSNG